MVYANNHATEIEIIVDILVTTREFVRASLNAIDFINTLKSDQSIL